MGTVKENKLVSPFFLFYLIHSTQTGVGMLKFQANIIKGAGNDSWLSVLIFGLFLHLVLWMMLYILKQSNEGDIISFHQSVFGKYIGNVMNLILAIYFGMSSLFAFHTYVDILQIWVFDGIAAWEFSLLLSVIIFYVVAGGFRIITAISFFGVIIPALTLFLFLYLFEYIDLTYVKPFFNHDLKDYVISAKEAATIFLGFETVLVYYPFINERKKANKWGYLAILTSTLLYTITAFFTFMFFTQEKLEHLTWPTLQMIKFIQFPFLERFEFIFIFTWLLVVMPVICVSLWASIRTIKLTIPNLKPTFILIVFLLIFNYVNGVLTQLEFSLKLATFTSMSGLFIILVYIPLLFIIAVIKNKLAKN